MIHSVSSMPSLTAMVRITPQTNATTNTAAGQFRAVRNPQPVDGAGHQSVLERRGDLNGDGRVDQVDLGLVLASRNSGAASDTDVNVVLGYWGQDVSGLKGVPLNSRDYGDLNGDGIVNQTDLGLLTANVGSLDRRAIAMADVNRDGIVDDSDAKILTGFFGLRIRV
ncbi:MAG: hypothetical protein HRU75_09305 [Planctomycetia bacterium]|nr:MAG: hypothetical protein HRU75_09305 [Planctomycetia bacterium]